MDASDALAFVRSNHRAVLATTRHNGRPQLSPVTVSADADGFVVISTRETAMKTKNIERDPAVTVCVMNDAFFGEWRVITGTAHIVRLPEAMERLVEYYRSVSGEHPDWDDYRAAMVRDRRVIVRIGIEDVGPERGG